MPAAAVIPAPIAYIKVVAVKKLVVDLLRGIFVGSATLITLIRSRTLYVLNWSIMHIGHFTEKKLECSKQVVALNTQAWNNGIRLESFLLVIRL